MKHLLSLVLLCFSAALLPAQIPPNWDTNPPWDTATVKYSVGVSTPQATEQGALNNAW